MKRVWLGPWLAFKSYVQVMQIRGQGPWLEENPCVIPKTISHMLLSNVWKGYDPRYGWPLRATYRWCFWMPQHLQQSVGLKSFCPWCLKLGGTPKQSLSILERSILGWWSCAIYAGHLQAWTHRVCYSTTCMQSLTKNAWNMRNMERQKSHTRRSPGPGDKRRFPNYPD